MTKERIELSSTGLESDVLPLNYLVKASKGNRTLVPDLQGRCSNH